MSNKADKETLEKLALLEDEVRAKLEEYNRIAEAANQERRLMLLAGENDQSIEDCEIFSPQVHFWFPSSMNC